ncbi:MAG: ATP synthase subunit alpha [Candidatus Daviesbacteria bacterium GW2011_GWA1_41_61]|uniref:ATP synthase subunit alpha n=1 Tax=Candidatus Daviesbacteria bacterium GW2011_GWA2_40_9 TaxID=1618424 RepID=A0A0G0X426_9BACT|nr:MAG: ATP synthase subunit alpha [Candidatus Daviesbacteria bacterium GW2011_GWC1_40_9]KKR82372.1 MAG: ATP synthase subunit alpha [Candidatus Daviesbacteria bacterium GW2011_GWA2_40_9]KKR92758.1 MAG: ATP synthase subunit alpha [Candidatus Daviesbacteria bacterium GW2011_GWB1_41_15]KKS14517.1 MAG: ATP synthase subunit alpha [Candidatus Daviesbacteria bacterium GW2011_GWA1_41_61]
MEEVGFVKSIKNFLAYLDGLPSARVNDLVVNDQGLRGWISALLPDTVEILLLDDGVVSPGQIFHCASQKMTVPVGEFLLGRAVNSLGVAIDGKGPLSKNTEITYADLDPLAPGISSREFISQQFDTGITLVDTLIPLGQGQRELVLGDARSGKTDFLTNVIINQKHTGVICVYALIGKPVSEVRSLIDMLYLNDALKYTVVVAAASSDPAPLIFLTPQTAFAMAEYFQKQGKDVLIVLDDLGNHAKIYREIALLANRPPGRESYPGDIFYQHSHLLERAGNFKEEAGGGSITALPVIELNLGDFTTLIPTNLMGMTDGHLLFKASLYNQGQRPAIDVSLSVSRVGQQTQNRVQNSLATQIKQILAQASQLETVSRFSFELPASTQLVLKQREMLEELMKQPALGFTPKELQIVLLALPMTPFMQNRDREFVKKYKESLVKAFLGDPELVQITKATTTFKNDQELFLALEKVSNKLGQIISQYATQNAAAVRTSLPQPSPSPVTLSNNNKPPTNKSEKEEKQ